MVGLPLKTCLFSLESWRNYDTNPTWKIGLAAYELDNKQSKLCRLDLWAGKIFLWLDFTIF